MRIVGVISGTVTDPSGAGVPDAKVVLKDEVNGTLKEARTNASGQFVFPDLPFGTFEITVTMAGFQSSIVNHIAVNASQTTDVPVSLRVGQQAESITVEGTTPLLETTSPLVAATLDTHTVNELPSTSRSLLGLARLTPGMTTGGGDTRFNNVPGGAVE